MIRSRLLAAFSLAAVALVGLAPAEAKTAHDVVVSADPVDWTPHVLDGEVKSIVQVGQKMVVGGAFRQVREAGSQTVLDRHNLFAFDAATGAVDPSFTPDPDGRVEALAAGPDGRSVFAGGIFTRAGGRPASLLARLDLATGAPVTGFAADVTGTSVQDLAVSGSTLYLGGAFSAVGGVNRSGLAAVDAATGAVDPGLDLPFTDPRQDVLKVETIALSPDGSRLVAGGNFTRVAGADRFQMAMVDTSAKPARLVDWETDRFKPPCNRRWATYIRDVDVAPDGSYFVVVTNGAFNPGTLCDTVTRWEMGATGTALQPTWIDHSGGDTFTAVAASGEAIYVGGHQRWMNNPYPNHTGLTATAGRGGVPRLGIAALDPQNGLPLSWNPGRARGGGAFALVPTPDGLWVGSDTDEFGGEFHGRVALCPLAGGAPIPAVTPATLPGRLERIGVDGTLTERSFDGTTAGPPQAVGGAVDWSHTRGAFMVGGTLYTGGDDGHLWARPFDGATAGPPTDVDLYGLTASDFPVASLTGMFYDAGRLYYTVAGDKRLYYRYFEPEDSVVGAESFVASGAGDGLDWRGVAGLSLASGHVYFSLDDGSLRAVDWKGGRPVPGTTSTVTGAGGGWASQGLFFLSR